MEENKSVLDRFLIKSSIFQNCSSTIGGAIAFFNLGNVAIEDTIFLENQVSKAGGAIAMMCDNFGRDFNKCSLRIKDTLFLRNWALIEGGAIKWNFYEPQMDNLTFRYNYAGEYGDNIASIAS